MRDASRRLAWRVRVSTRRARWVARPRDFAAAIRARRPFVVEVSPSSTSPSMRRSGFPRRCTSRARRRRPTSAANIIRGHEPPKASTSRTPLARGRATEPRTRDEARCGVPGRSETPGLRDVRRCQRRLEDASREKKSSRAMRLETRNSRRFRFRIEPRSNLHRHPSSSTRIEAISGMEPECLQRIDRGSPAFDAPRRASTRARTEGAFRRRSPARAEGLLPYCIAGWAPRSPRRSERRCLDAFVTCR